MAEAVVILAFVGKAVASSVITNLVNRAFTKFDELRKSEGMKATKEKLDQNLPRIAAVLLAVDRGQIMDRNGNLDKWLWQLRDAVEEAEDAIDQLDYYQLKEKAKHQADPHSVGTTSIKKMTKLINKHVPCIGDDSLGRLKKAVEGLNNAATGVGPFLQLVNTLGNSSGGINQTHADTGAMLTEAKVFGRDMEKHLILKWLSNHDGPEVSAFSLVGMGGLGKTTLARLIYNEIADKKVLEFSLVVWVSVSDIFGTPDAKVIIRMILQDITQSSYDLNNLNTLQTSLKKKVETEKFLIIFDDVWQDGPQAENQWKQIMAPLKFGQKGSKILLTTRMEVVANMMAKVMEGTAQKNNHLLLGGLEENEFLKLFNKHVFGTENPTEYKNCQRLAKQVVKKLWGSPLAVRVMESLLNNHTDIQYWDQITKQDISNIQINQNEIMASLKKSYHHLREEEQQCFRYCSLFPQDHKFKRDELIKMWIGSGLIQQSDSTQTLEESGAGYFDTLVRKSFFHVRADSEDCYLMHDFMHEMAAFVSSGECLRTKTVSSERIPGTIRHVCITIQSLIAIKEISHLRHLQSLFIEFDGEKPELADVKEFEKALKKLKSLRDVTFPKWISNSIPNLTSLELRDCARCNTLPPLGKLLSLKYLSLSNFHELELIPVAFYGRIPGGGDAFPSLKELRIRALTSLKVLRLSGCNNLVTIPLPQSPSDADSEKPNLEIQELHIDHISLLLQEPLKSICQVKKLLILNNHQPESLPKQWLENCTSLEEIEVGNACALKGLFSNLDELIPDLKKLVMHQAGLIISLPNLPPSLSDLVITGCNDTFKQKYKKDTGSNWYELADVTTVVIL
ncbi:hypothetical protein LUZ61_004030 [Rhynchospora tenuis]|uniref:NB-ARC domain-containing protein n=1 Tax=Rhynchospora tenuis TaxID=198213 RepID=A0AAD5ZLX3_9POAL|nr:hypothetical protein LUZ61_004030 [Rhynchospora tenuis]